MNIEILDENIDLYLDKNSVQWTTLTSYDEIKSLNIGLSSVKTEEFAKLLFNKIKYLNCNSLRIGLFAPINIKMSNFIYVQYDNLTYLDITITLSKEGDRNGCFIWKTSNMLRNLTHMSILITVAEPTDKKDSLYEVKRIFPLNFFSTYFQTKEKQIQFIFSEVEAKRLLFGIGDSFFQNVSKVLRSAVLSKIYKYDDNFLKESIIFVDQFHLSVEQKGFIQYLELIFVDKHSISSAIC